MSAQYDGPGVYEVTLRYSGTRTIEVEATSRDEAERKATLEDDGYLECECDEVSFVRCVEELPVMDFITDRSLLTGAEEAAWIFTGKVPAEALQRILELEKEAAA